MKCKYRLTDTILEGECPICAETEAAVLAERERCAGVADGKLLHRMNYAGGVYNAWVYDGGVAEAIRQEPEA